MNDIITDMDIEIKKGLDPLFKEARENNKLFRSSYQGIIFSPDKLESEQKSGRYRWGAVNWELIDPEYEYKRLCDVARNHKKIAEQFKVNYLL